MNELLTTFTAASLVALIYALVNFLKHLTNLDLPDSKNAVVTQLTVWVAAIAVLLLGAQADIAEQIPLVNASPLGQLDVPSLILLALGMGSLASVTRDFFKSRDDTQTIATPQITRMERRHPSGLE